jgi:hypothetical protein
MIDANRIIFAFLNFGKFGKFGQINYILDEALCHMFYPTKSLSKLLIGMTIMLMEILTVELF